MKMSGFANAMHCGSMGATFSGHVSVIKFALYSLFPPFFFFFFTTPGRREEKQPNPLAFWID